MAFKFDVSDEFYRKVEIRLANGGGFKKYPLEVRFEYLQGDKLKERMSEHQLTRDFLTSIIRGWKDFRVSGELVEFTPENLEYLLSYESAVKALYEMFFAAIAGDNNPTKN